MLKDLADYRVENPRLYWRFHKAIANRDPEVIGKVLFMGMGRRWQVDPEAYESYCQARTEDWLKENTPKSQPPRSGVFPHRKAKPRVAARDLR